MSKPLLTVNELVNKTRKIQEIQSIFYNNAGPINKPEGRIEKTSDNFIAIDRIEFFKQVNNLDFDLNKIIRLCEEINFAYLQGCYYSVIILCRALIDHIPPVFSLRKFSEIPNNYAGGKSFKDAMLHLDNTLRKIADTHIHTQISKHCTLPNRNQVNFMSDIDFLLAEMINILKGKKP